jgi:hypothetical protein
MGAVKWSPDAREDLRQITDGSVRAEILELAEAELGSPDDPQPGFEGRSTEDGNIFYRRAVRRDELADFMSWDLDEKDDSRNYAWNYVIIYRYMTMDEVINFGISLMRERPFFRRLPPPFVVLRVVHNREFARLY